MNIYALMTFMAVFIYVYLGFYAFSKDSKSPLNRSFLHLCIALTVWALAYAFIYPSKSEQTVMKFLQFAAIGIAFVPGLLLRFVAYYSLKKDFIKRFWGFILIYGPALVLLIKSQITGILTVTDVTWTRFGWIETLEQNSIWMWFTLLYYIIYFSISGILLLYKFIHTRVKREKRQSINILLSIFISLIMSLTADIIFPLINIPYVPAIAPIFTLIFAFVIGYTITKHQLMKLTPEIATEKIISQIDNLIILINTDFKIISTNKFLETLTGYSLKDLFRKYLDVLFESDDAHEVFRILKLKHLYDSETLNLEVKIKMKKTEEMIPLRIFINSIEEQESKDLLGFLIVGFDLRQQIHIDELEKGKEIQTLKSKFITMASHEFRTPLSTIMLSVDILERHSYKLSDDKRANYFKQIKLAITRLTQLMDEILLVDQSSTGHLKLDKRTLNLTQLIDNIVEEYSLTWEERYSIQYLRPRKERIVNVDEKVIRNIIYNLLSNAIKYSPEGSTITLQIDYLINHVQMTIQDNGFGIDESDVPHIYERFYRGKNVSTISGSGLGISIVKDAVELHHGEIDLKTEVGKGTTFTIRIPI